ncbi:methyl-accepting chemotaxis protein [Lutispora thermophila]|uniref:Methyl-accepting chemotaxis protein (MCP) signalling domain-containing protein n=1 Tax=Lutispora thermophila DSM 19022 TaxID=1122184 RepID=A0A1M6E300_9FIRM|nr:methyl-accepting chemotaxis protein [Lutispora thermophila]SHI79769.1 Methyl-accepting chemotaxis protein (MCP) signalling domain-containing protein [Lutispora thermophila DSM 19022]
MNIAVVGAGTGGSKIIKTLSSISDVKVTIIIDKNMDAPGIALAKEMGIKYSDSLDDIEKEAPDLIIEATGIPAVSDELTKSYKNICEIINYKGAKLFMSLVEKNNHTLSRLNYQIAAVKEASSIVQTYLNQINNSIDNVHEVSNRLLEIANNSNNHIIESDKILQYVNKIAKQIKILGINANIESARAGEQGKGFSIVAKEVQNLADNSEISAKEINKILFMLSEEISKITDQLDSLKNYSMIQVEASKKATKAVEDLLEKAQV